MVYGRTRRLLETGCASLFPLPAHSSVLFSSSDDSLAEFALTKLQHRPDRLFTGKKELEPTQKKPWMEPVLSSNFCLPNLAPFSCPAMERSFAFALCVAPHRRWTARGNSSLRERSEIPFSSERVGLLVGPSAVERQEKTVIK